VWRAGNRPGFTLLEALVAVVIIGLVSVSALASVSSQLRTADRARRMIEAEALAEDRLSVVLLLTGEQLQSLPDSVAHGRFTAPFGVYTWRVRSIPMPSENYVDEIHIVVEWPDGAYTMSTCLYRPPSLPGSPS